MNKESFNQNQQNQDRKTAWDDVADYLPQNFESSQENEKRERSFEKIAEYNSKYFERNQDGSYNFLGIDPNEKMSDGVKTVIANRLFSNYMDAYNDGDYNGLNKDDTKAYQEKIEKNRNFVNKNVEKIIKGEVLNQVDFSLNDKEVLVQEYNIDGLNFRFFNTTTEQIGAFVKDEDGVIKARGFRDSGSDHQFKNVPGMNGMRWIKGDEWDPNTHYVQSGKVDRRIYRIFNDLRQKRGLHPKDFETSLFGIADFISLNIDAQHNVEKGTEAFEFSEKQHEFKNEKWNRIRQYLTDDFKKFMKIKKYGHEFAKKDGLSEDKYAEWFDDRFIKNEKLFNAMEKSGMVPDFNEGPRARYYKDDGNIRVEVFPVDSDEGDNLCWAMAVDRQNRVYIDDIFTQDVPVDSYGTPSEKVNMGMLIYKPEDYAVQNRGIPDKYVKVRKSNNEDYEDISAMLRELPPVQKYIHSLIARKK